MRTLIVATQIRLPGKHGGATHVGELARNLERYGDVLVLAQLGSKQRGVAGISLPFRVPRPTQRLLPHLYLPRALKAARRFRPDVIYERGSSYGLGALLSERLRVPMICMLLDEHFSERSLSRASKIIATTEQVVPERVRNKLVKVSWGANADLFHPSIEPVGSELLGMFDGATVGYAGSFKRWHDLDLLVSIAEKLKSRKIRFLLVGDGPERTAIERRVEAAGLSDSFVFAGAVPYEAVPRWLARADVCVAPFRPAEHTASRGNFALDPLKVFEYLALGKPSISIDAENIRGLLQHEEHALLLPPSDVERWADALLRLIDNPDAAREMATRGRNQVLARYTWAAHAAQLHDIFDGLLDEQRARA